METDLQLRWRRVKEVFQRALECDEAERAALIRSLCGGDSDFEARVHALLRHEQAANAHGFLSPVAYQAAPPSCEPAPGVTGADTLPSDVARWQVPGYRLLQQLGEGGMGQVWSAVQEGTEQEVAIKFVRPELLYSERARDRFDREIKLTASLNHRHIARVYAAGVAAGRRFYVMELIRGQRLDEYLQAKPREGKELWQLFRMICRAMQCAHERDVIHRDLKPSNILVTPDGEPKIVDFGLARETVHGRSPLTLSGPLGQMGTPGYMSPEQCSGADVDARTDVFALGVILADMVGLRQQVPRAPGAVGNGATGSQRRNQHTEAVIRRATAPVAEDRYPNAGALANDIERLIASAGRRRRTLFLAPLATVLLGVLAVVQYRRHDAESVHHPLSRFAAADVLRTLASENPPGPAGVTSDLTLRFTIDARRRGSHRFAPLEDGDTLASPDRDAGTRDDEYVLLLEPQSSGYLYVFQVDSTGQVQWLFPRNDTTASSGANPVAPGGLVQLPEPANGKLHTFVLDHNAGVEHVYAVFCVQRWAALETELSSSDRVSEPSPVETNVTVTDPFQLLRGDRRGVGGVVVYDEQSTEQPSTESAELPRVSQRLQSRANFLLIERWFRHAPL